MLVVPTYLYESDYSVLKILFIHICLVMNPSAPCEDYSRYTI